MEKLVNRQRLNLGPKNFVMENAGYITTVFSKLDLPETLLESLAKHRNENRPTQVIIPDVLETIDHNSSETYTTGVVEVIFVSDDLEDFGYINVPVITPFLFTCTKGSEEEFDVEWATSLS
jgi:hypothetical protein